MGIICFRTSVAIAESNIVDALPAAMLCGFQQVDQVLKSSVPGQAVVEVLPRNFSNRRDFDVASLQPVLSAHFDMGDFPDAHTGRYCAALDEGAEFLGEEHKLALTVSRAHWRPASASLSSFPTFSPSINLQGRLAC